MREINLITILAAIALLDQQFAYGLECYVCKSTSATSSCVSEDSSEACDKAYCTIFRRELRDPPGILTAFYRACEDSPTYLNAVINTPYHKTYYRACTNDLCNSGDGIEAFTTVIEEKSSTDSIIVPGIGSHASVVFPGTIYSVILISTAFFLALYNE